MLFLASLDATATGTRGACLGLALLSALDKEDRCLVRELSTLTVRSPILLVGDLGTCFVFPLLLKAGEWGGNPALFGILGEFFFNRLGELLTLACSIFFPRGVDGDLLLLFETLTE